MNLSQAENRRMNCTVHASSPVWSYACESIVRKNSSDIPNIFVEMISPKVSHGIVTASCTGPSIHLIDADSVHRIEHHPSSASRLIVVTSDIAVAIRYYHEGFAGIVLNTPEDPQWDLRTVILAIGTGHSWCSPRLSRTALASTEPVKLTPKEWAVATLVADGLSNKQIAHARGTATKTVQAHRFNLYKKLEVTNAVELRKTLEQVGYLCAPPAVVQWLKEEANAATIPTHHPVVGSEDPESDCQSTMMNKDDSYRRMMNEVGG